MDKRKISRKKSRQMAKANDASRAVSRFFRRVRIGDEIHMGEVHDIAQKIENAGRALENVARDVLAADMRPEVFADISNQVYRLQVYAAELKNISTKYFGFPVKGMALFTPTIRQEVPKKIPEGIKNLLEEMREK